MTSSIGRSGKGKTVATNKSVVARGWGDRGEWGSIEDFLGSETAPNDTRMMDTGPYTLVQTHRKHTKSDP